MGFSRQEHWSGLPFLSPGDLPNPGIQPRSPALAGRFFTIWATRGALSYTSHFHGEFTIHFIHSCPLSAMNNSIWIDTNSLLSLNLISLSIRLGSQKTFWGPKQYGVSAKALRKMKKWRENDDTTPLRKGEGPLFGRSSRGGVWVYRWMNSGDVELEGGCKFEAKQNHRRRSQAKGVSRGPFLLLSPL